MPNYVRQFIGDLGKWSWSLWVGVVMDLYALAQTTVDVGWWPGIPVEQGGVPTSAYWAIGSLLIVAASFKAYVTKSKAFEESESRHSLHDLRREFEDEFSGAREALRSIRPILRRAYGKYGQPGTYWRNTVEEELRASGHSRFAERLLGGLVGGHGYEDDPERLENGLGAVGDLLNTAMHYKRRFPDFYEEYVEDRIRKQWRSIAALVVAVQHAQRERDYEPDEIEELKPTAAMLLWDEWKDDRAGSDEKTDD